mmetsp:Transcript_16682/g.14594  ORF Transcript_16682/g.14594 Transcript_16682/m.14594 type:complete len:199 (+) Transcript_16682:327-923(+)
MTITDRGNNSFFGIKEYRTPKVIIEGEKKHKSNISNFNRTKFVSFITEQAEKMKKLPSPNTYCSIIQWDKKKIKGGFLNKTQKISCIDELIKKSQDSPGVGKYKWNKPFKLRGYSRERNRKTTFLDEVKVYSKEVPGPNKYKVNHSKIMNRGPNYSFRKLRKNKERIKTKGSFIRREDGIIISNRIAPGYYKAEQSYT